jgi:hypothetical protein
MATAARQVAIEYCVSLNGHSGEAGGDRILRQSKWP